jgi:hypothetical protein
MAQISRSLFYVGLAEQLGVTMTFFVQMLAHTPPYVFVLLAYLIWQGVQSLRTRRLPIWRMLIVPGLFEATGLLLLVLRPSSDIMPMAAWLVGLVAFAPLGFVTGPRLLAVERTSVIRAGSRVSLVRNLLVFGAQYGIAVALFRHPEAHASLTVAGHAVSGTSVGYIIGWTIAFRRRYLARRNAAFSTLATGSPGSLVQKS